jgi:hypothetical protein
VRETYTEVCTIYVQLLRAWNVHILTSGAINFDTRGRKLLTNTNWKDILPFAQNSRTIPEGPKHVFLFHHGKPTGRYYKSSMYQAVEIHGRLIDFKKTKLEVRFGTYLTFDLRGPPGRDFPRLKSYSYPHYPCVRHHLYAYL